MVSEGGPEPPRPIRALAPPASASASSATRTRVRRNGSKGEARESHRGRASAGCQDGVMAEHSREPQGAASDPVHDPFHDPAHDAAGEVVELCRDLIRIDTSNYGDEDGPGERKAAEHVAALLDEVGIEAKLYESEPGRTSVLAHWGGSS